MEVGVVERKRENVVISGCSRLDGNFVIHIRKKGYYGNFKFKSTALLLSIYNRLKG